MSTLLIFVCVFFVGIGWNRAATYAKARRTVFETLLVDPAPAASHAFWLLVAAEKIPAWKRRAFAVLEYAVDVTTWPVPEVLEYLDRRRSPDYVAPEFMDTRWRGTREELTQEYASRRTRRRSLLTCATSLFLVVVAGATVTRLADAVQIWILCWIVVIGTAARQTQDLLADKLMSTVAKRSGLPLTQRYRDLVLSAAADLVTLAACSVLLLRWVPGQPVRLEWLKEQLLAVVNGGNFAHLPPALSQSPSAVLVAVASLTFYSSLLGPLKNMVWRRRSGDDLVAAAESAARRGHLERAKDLLASSRSKLPPPSSIAVSRAEGVIALLNGRTLEAWEAARAVVRLERPQENLDELRQHEEALLRIQGWCEELGVKARPSVVELGRDLPVRDSMMAYLLAHHLDALLPESAAEGRAAALESLLDPVSWPLTFSIVHELDGDVAAAAQSLPAAESFTGLDLLWRNQMARTRASKRAKALPGIQESEEGVGEDARALLADIAGSDITTWPEWHRRAFARAIALFLLSAEAEGLDEKLVRALTSTLDAVAGEHGEYAKLEVLRNIGLRKAH